MSGLMSCLVVILICSFYGYADARIYDFEVDGGAKAEDNSWETVLKNGAALNASLGSLNPGDTFLVPNKTFYLMGGVKASDLHSVVFQLDGTLAFGSTFPGNAERYIKAWPRNDHKVLECLEFHNVTNFTFSSSGEGQLDGHGAKWWGIPGIGYLVRQENRPRLLKITSSREVVVEHWFLKNSPYWNFLADGVSNIEVRHSRIDARRDDKDSHTALDLSAFNTDGFDFSSCNGVYVHDCSVWNQDDCFDVKDGTSNVLIERVNASGLGLTVGSIASTVRNITFRDAYMHHTAKGIYMKFRGAGLVADVTYENIVMDAPEQFAIWIGPAQQCDGCPADDLCRADPCSLCWPGVKGAECHGVDGGQYANITLRNITINNPKQSAGVLLANESVPMINVLFHNVVVNNPASKPFPNGYYCKNVQGVATGTTSPVPPCLQYRA